MEETIMVDGVAMVAVQVDFLSSTYPTNSLR
jgi:hypothetical protein